MKKVLIVANLFHASPRIPGLAKYLPEFGWQPIILTVPVGEKPDSQVRVIEARTHHYNLGFWKKRLFGFKSVQSRREQVAKRLGVASKKSFADFLVAFYARLHTLYGAVFEYPDSERGWKPFAVTAGNELLQNEHIDAVISSSSPVTSHLIAKELKIKHEIPWIADLRDLWSQNHNYSLGPIRKAIDRRLEVKTLSRADALTTTTEPWAEKLRMLHKRKQVYAVIHGFDPVIVDKKAAKLTSKFTITYTGTIYLGKQEPSKLFTALQDLISSGHIDAKDVEVRFYGYEKLWLVREIEEYGLSSIVKLHERVPRRVVFEKQKESQLLLLLNWEDRQVKGWCPLKLIDYLAARRPILATGGFGNDVIYRLLNETKAGIYCKTVEDIKKILAKLYSQYKLKRKTIYEGDIKKINKYSYREMAKKFVEVLDGIT